MTDKIVSLESRDGRIFRVSEKIGKESALISMMLEFSEGGSIPIPNVNGNILEKVIRFITYYHEKKSEDKEWDKSFYSELTPSQLIEIILSANYLDIKKLLDSALKASKNVPQSSFNKDEWESISHFQ